MDELTADERAEIDAKIARDTANVILDMMQGVPLNIAYNIIGNLTVSVFLAAPFASPNDAIEEYEHWVAYTRQMIADGLKERLQ